MHYFRSLDPIMNKPGGQDRLHDQNRIESILEAQSTVVIMFTVGQANALSNFFLALMFTVA